MPKNKTKAKQQQQKASDRNHCAPRTSKQQEQINSKNKTKY